MSRFGWAEPLVDRTPEAARPQPWDCSLLWGKSRHRVSLVWREPQACKALKLRQRSSALTFYPQYETFLRECGLYTVVSLLGQSPCKELVTGLLERWRPETNTFHLLQGEATITLEDVEVLTGLPTRGRPVSVGYDARAADNREDEYECPFCLLMLYELRSRINGYKFTKYLSSKGDSLAFGCGVSC
ncbi:Serine/threonine-protein phosphatase 7 long form homolog [Linum perenne]